MNLKDSKYPSASEIPELNMPGGDATKPNGGGAAPQNPVLTNLQGLQTFVLTLEKQGNPQAGAIKQAFMALLQAIQQMGGAGGPSAKPGQPPAPGAPGQPPPGAAPGQAPAAPGAPQAGGMNNTMPMNANATAKPAI
jgi:hypothetical protein